MVSTLPQIDKLLRQKSLVEAQAEFRRDVIAAMARQVLEELRQDTKQTSQTGPRNGKTLQPKEISEDNHSLEIIENQILKRLKALSSPSLNKLINGTGVVLNTNLGRAPLAPSHIDELRERVCGYANLEFDLVSGKRGKRSSRLEELLKVLTGCEAAIVVNNNAAAVVLAVNCFARDKEVIVSRGELIEIGGSFRLPEVIESGAAKLKEVGTTNRTRAQDYEKAIGEKTGLIMRCHRSNFEIQGFTEEAKLKDLVAISAKFNIPFLEDLGSGVLSHLEGSGLDKEPTVAEVVSSGCDLVSFSGDKLLGGPQAGIIVGRKELVGQLAKSPLFRALRLDKVRICLLEQTLASYLSPNPQDKLPVLAMLLRNPQSIEKQVSSFVKRLSTQVPKFNLEIVGSDSTAGGGSLPGQTTASFALKIKSPLTPSKLALLFRQCSTPVIGLIKDDSFLIDFRTVPQEDEDHLLESMQEVERKI